MRYNTRSNKEAKKVSFVDLKKVTFDKLNILVEKGMPPPVRKYKRNVIKMISPEIENLLDKIEKMQVTLHNLQDKL